MTMITRTGPSGAAAGWVGLVALSALLAATGGPLRAQDGGNPAAKLRQASDHKTGRTAPAPAIPQLDAGEAIGELQPVLHARSAKITTCMDSIVATASSVIDRPHTAVSTWVSRDPNAHAFQSIVGLSYPSKIAPNGAAVIFAAPTGPAACEGGSVQIFPTAQPCSIVQAGLLKSGHTLTALQALPVVETNDGARNVLMPTAGSGCVVVTVRPR